MVNASTADQPQLIAVVARTPTLDLLFLKSPAYEDEDEYRIVRIFDEAETSAPVRDYDIDLNCIQGIVLSPWMPKELSWSVINLEISILTSQYAEI